MQVLTAHGRRKELEAYANAGFLLENSMHSSSRDVDDGLMCSMYDVLRLYLVLNQLLLNEWDVLECLQWPPDATLPEGAQGLLDPSGGKSKSKSRSFGGARVDKFRAMPPEPLMKLVIGSQLHWVASITAQLEGVAGGDAAGAAVAPQFARSQAWLDIGRHVRNRTITTDVIRAFCEEHLFAALVTTEYMMAYDRARCSERLPLPVGEAYWEEFVTKKGCWKVGSVTWQVMNLDMRLEALTPRRGWGGYGYYNDRAPLKDAWFTKVGSESD